MYSPLLMNVDFLIGVAYSTVIDINGWIAGCDWHLAESQSVGGICMVDISVILFHRWTVWYLMKWDQKYYLKQTSVKAMGDVSVVIIL